MEFQKASGFLRNAYYQGHGRYVNQIVRMTIKFCKNSGGSREMRKFIETRLVDTAKENPGCVIYVKPRLFKSPVMKAEYLNGNEHYLSFYKMSSAQIEAWVKWYLTRSGAELIRINRPVSTMRPSIQGIWTPFMFRDPKLNLAEFPSEELGRHISKVPSATEQLVQMQKSASNR
jgi:large subunit ribosomal protein L43